MYLNTSLTANRGSNHRNSGASEHPQGDSRLNRLPSGNDQTDANALTQNPTHSGNSNHNPFANLEIEPLSPREKELLRDLVNRPIGLTYRNAEAPAGYAPPPLWIRRIDLIIGLRKCHVIETGQPIFDASFYLGGSERDQIFGLTSQANDTDIFGVCRIPLKTPEANILQKHRSDAAQQVSKLWKSQLRRRVRKEKVKEITAGELEKTRIGIYAGYKKSLRLTEDNDYWLQLLESDYSTGPLSHLIRGRLRGSVEAAVDKYFQDNPKEIEAFKQDLEQEYLDDYYSEWLVNTYENIVTNMVASAIAAIPNPAFHYGDLKYYFGLSAFKDPNSGLQVLQLTLGNGAEKTDIQLRNGIPSRAFICDAILIDIFNEIVIYTAERSAVEHSILNQIAELGDQVKHTADKLSQLYKKVSRGKLPIDKEVVSLYRHLIDRHLNSTGKALSIVTKKVDKLPPIQQVQILLNLARYDRLVTTGLTEDALIAWREIKQVLKRHCAKGLDETHLGELLRDGTDLDTKSILETIQALNALCFFDAYRIDNGQHFHQVRTHEFRLLRLAMDIKNERFHAAYCLPQYTDNIKFMHTILSERGEEIVRLADHLNLTELSNFIKSKKHELDNPNAQASQVSWWQRLPYLNQKKFQVAIDDTLTEARYQNLIQEVASEARMTSDSKCSIQFCDVLTSFTSQVKGIRYLPILHKIMQDIFENGDKAIGKLIHQNPPTDWTSEIQETWSLIKHEVFHHYIQQLRINDISQLVDYFEQKTELPTKTLLSDLGYLALIDEHLRAQQKPNEYVYQKGVSTCDFICNLALEQIDLSFSVRIEDKGNSDHENVGAAIQTQVLNNISLRQRLFKVAGFFELNLLKGELAQKISPTPLGDPEISAEPRLTAEPTTTALEAVQTVAQKKQQQRAPKRTEIAPAEAKKIKTKQTDTAGIQAEQKEHKAQQQPTPSANTPQKQETQNKTETKNSSKSKDKNKSKNKGKTRTNDNTHTSKQPEIIKQKIEIKTTNTKVLLEDDPDFGISITLNELTPDSSAVTKISLVTPLEPSITLEALKGLIQTPNTKIEVRENDRVKHLFIDHAGQVSIKPLPLPIVSYLFEVDDHLQVQLPADHPQHDRMERILATKGNHQISGRMQWNQVVFMGIIGITAKGKFANSKKKPSGKSKSSSNKKSKNKNNQVQTLTLTPIKGNFYSDEAKYKDRAFSIKNASLDASHLSLLTPGQGLTLKQVGNSQRYQTLLDLPNFGWPHPARKNPPQGILHLSSSTQMLQQAKELLTMDTIELNDFIVDDVYYGVQTLLVGDAFGLANPPDIQLPGTPPRGWTRDEFTQAVALGEKLVMEFGLSKQPTPSSPITDYQVRIGHQYTPNQYLASEIQIDNLKDLKVTIATHEIDSSASTVVSSPLELVSYNARLLPMNTVRQTLRIPIMEGSKDYKNIPNLRSLMEKAGETGNIILHHELPPTTEKVIDPLTLVSKHAVPGPGTHYTLFASQKKADNSDYFLYIGKVQINPLEDQRDHQVLTFTSQTKGATITGNPNNKMTSLIARPFELSLSISTHSYAFEVKSNYDFCTINEATPHVLSIDSDKVKRLIASGTLSKKDMIGIQATLEAARFSLLRILGILKEKQETDACTFIKQAPKFFSTPKAPELYKHHLTYQDLSGYINPESIRYFFPATSTPTLTEALDLAPSTSFNAVFSSAGELTELTIPITIDPNSQATLALQRSGEDSSDASLYLPNSETPRLSFAMEHPNTDDSTTYQLTIHSGDRLLTFKDQSIHLQTLGITDAESQGLEGSEDPEGLSRREIREIRLQTKEPSEDTLFDQYVLKSNIFESVLYDSDEGEGRAIGTFEIINASGSETHYRFSNHPTRNDFGLPEGMTYSAELSNHELYLKFGQGENTTTAKYLIQYEVVGLDTEADTEAVFRSNPKLSALRAVAPGIFEVTKMILENVLFMEWYNRALYLFPKTLEKATNIKLNAVQAELRANGPE